MTSRDLSRGEISILEVIQEGYGPQNTVADVIFTDRDEAVIFVKRSDGTKVLLVNLTNLAAWRADGTIPDDGQLRSFWLRL